MCSGSFFQIQKLIEIPNTQIKTYLSAVNTKISKLHTEESPVCTWQVCMVFS